MDAVSFVTAPLSSVYTMAIENVINQHNTMQQLCYFLNMAFKGSTWNDGEIRMCETIKFKTIYLIVDF